jgi:hypothetical protein
MREVLPLIEILDEIKDNIKGIGDIIPEVHCKVFEDNSGAVEVATSAKHPKMRPRTKHINNKYHHFRESVVKILSVSTKEMLADILTKICNEETPERGCNFSLQTPRIILFVPNSFVIHTSYSDFEYHRLLLVWVRERHVIDIIVAIKFY